MPELSGKFTRELTREIEKFEKRSGIKVLGFAFSVPEKVEGTAYGMAWFDNVHPRTEEEWYSAMEMERVPETPKHAEIVQKKPNSKRLLTEQAQLKGVTRALETLHRKKKRGQPCPYWLIPSLEKRKRDLEDKLRGGRRLMLLSQSCEVESLRRVLANAQSEKG